MASIPSASTKTETSPWVDEATAGNYALLMHLNSFMNAFSTALAIYLIVWKSPAAMGNYKWFLLNMTLCCCLFDSFVTAVYTPFTLYPAVGTCPLGLASFSDRVTNEVCWMLLNVLLGMCGMSVMCCMVYRLAAVTNRDYMVTKPAAVVAMILLHLFYTTPSIIAYIQRDVDENYERKEISTLFPGVLPFFEARKSCSTFYMRDYHFLVTYASVALAQIFFCLMVIVVIAGATFRQLASMRGHLSAKTYRMHKELTVSLVFQFLLPSSIIVLPYLAFGVSALVQHPYAQMLSLSTFVLSTWHTTANTVIMISFSRPYKQALRQMLPWRKPKDGVPSVSTFGSTTVNTRVMSSILRNNNRINSVY